MHIGVLALRSIESNSASTSHDIFRLLQRDHDVRHLGREFVSALSGGESLLRRIRRWTDGDSVLKEDADAYAAAVSEDLARERCDIVLGMFASRLKTSIKLPDGVPFVHMSDATPAIRPVPRSRYPLSDLITLEQRVLEEAALCLYPSHWAATSALEDFGIDYGKVHVIEWGGANEHDSPPSMSSRPGPGSRIELLFIGRDQQRKGIDRVVDAVDELVERGRDVRLTVIGGRLARQLRRPCIEDLGSLSLDDPDQHRMFEEVFARATCLVHPARHEPYGHVLVEACARGVPVICTELEGMPTIIKDHDNGLLVATEPSAEELCDAILAISDDHGLAEALGHGGRTAWEQRLSWKRWAERAVPLFERACSQ